MEMLPTMRSVADELQERADAVSRSFQTKGTTTFSEDLSVSIRLLIPQVSYHKEYVNFLESQSEMYDKIGNLQRTLYTEIQDKVKNPLKTWVVSDYDRIMNSIDLLKVKRRQMNAVMAEKSAVKVDVR
ncbi:unnamed protein product [Gongylonema pulchrum]|uniref:BAR domain-containing protein n=1 Tax=Gongylonema pulchrum TaxID=637853 RepID=A0A183D8D6_9BILA|nr:unnamed protein product [Gongylonema pulchrum]